MVLHVPKAAPKLELLASKPNRAFFLGHPVHFAKNMPLNSIYCISQERDRGLTFTNLSYFLNG